MIAEVKSSFCLSPSQVNCFREEGYVVLPQITSEEEVERLREIFDRLFATDAGRERGSQYDLAGTDDESRPLPFRRSYSRSILRRSWRKRSFVRPR